MSARCSALAVACALGASVADASSNKTVLKFGQDVDYPPYAFKNATTNELEGFGKDIAVGMNAICDDIEIQVVETKWSDCWSSANGGSLGASIVDGTVDACMTYTHTQGIRDKLCDFSNAILDVNKPAGLLAMLDANGEPKVKGDSDLAGLTIVDVAGWAPTADTIAYVENKCMTSKYSTNISMIRSTMEDANDDALNKLMAGAADAMFVYADQAYHYKKKCEESMNQTWNCTNWKKFGKEFAYVQTGQFGYVVNGTTLALSKKGSGVPEKIDSCLAKFMETKEYHDICVKHDLADHCFPNSFFTASDATKHAYMIPTSMQEGNCSTGYCSCPSAAMETSGSGNTAAGPAGVALGIFVLLGMMRF